MNEKSDFNSDGQYGNSLLYIPTEKELNEMLFTSVDSKGNTLKMNAEESRAAFKQWLENDSYAKNHRGQFAERNSNLSKWEHQIDLHLAQHIYNVQGVGKLEFTVDIINFANMLNKKWGASYDSAFNLSPLLWNTSKTERLITHITKLKSRRVISAHAGTARWV